MATIDSREARTSEESSTRPAKAELYSERISRMVVSSPTLTSVGRVRERINPNRSTAARGSGSGLAISSNIVYNDPERGCLPRGVLSHWWSKSTCAIPLMQRFASYMEIETARRFLPVSLRDRLQNERKTIAFGLVAAIASFLDRLGIVTSMGRSFIGRTFGAVKRASRDFRPFLFSTPQQLLAMTKAPNN